MEIKVLDIKTEQDREMYANYLSTVAPDNPFYKIQYFSFNLDVSYSLKYFMFSDTDQALGLMPFYLRPIQNGHMKETYFDVISPYGYSGPLFKKGLSKEYILSFWRLVDAWYNNNSIISEFVRFNLEGNHQYYSGTIVNSLKNVKGTILEEKEQWDNFKPKVRNNYRKAVQNNLSVEIYHGAIKHSVIDEFYAIYIATMRRNDALKSYFYPIECFTNFVDNNPGCCAIALVKKGNLSISAEFLLLSGKLIYSFLGGTNADYFYARPNDFLKIEVMKWGRKNALTAYILGGGRKDDDTLYKYKKTFFPKNDDVIYYTGRKIIDKKIYASLVEQKKVKSCGIDNKDNLTHFFPLYREED